jgi:hypothetical protein
MRFRICSGGCSVIESAHDLVHTTSKGTDTLKKDPGKLIGQTFEVDYWVKFPGLKTYKTILDLRQTTIETARPLKTSFLALGLLTTEYTNANLLTNLNTESNSEDKNINLIFEVLESHKFDDQETFLKIKLLNKKYFDTTWWISSYDFWGLAHPPRPGWKLKMPFHK